MPKRRRLLALLIANVMAAALTTAYATTYEVTASVLNVRTGPGTVYAVKAKLVQGDTVEVKTLEGPWALISLAARKRAMSPQATSPKPRMPSSLMTPVRKP